MGPGAFAGHALTVEEQELATEQANARSRVLLGFLHVIRQLDVRMQLHARAVQRGRARGLQALELLALQQPLLLAQVILGQVKGDKDGIDDLREAAEVLERSICQYERARALSAYGGTNTRTAFGTSSRTRRSMIGWKRPASCAITSWRNRTPKAM